MKKLLPILFILAASSHSPAESRWDFDATGNFTITESPKNPSQFVEGVRGKALVFDAFNTEIVVSTDKSPALSERFTISA